MECQFREDDDLMVQLLLMSRLCVFVRLLFIVLWQTLFECWCWASPFLLDLSTHSNCLCLYLKAPQVPLERSLFVILSLRSQYCCCCVLANKLWQYLNRFYWPLEFAMQLLECHESVSCSPSAIVTPLNSTTLWSNVRKPQQQTTDQEVIHGVTQSLKAVEFVNVGSSAE